MGLEHYDTDQLLAELKRRADAEERAKPFRPCEGCAHWRYSLGPRDTSPNCRKGHSMDFRMPLDYGDDNWGHHLPECNDFEQRPSDAPGPDLATSYTPEPAPHRPRRPPAPPQPATTPTPEGAAPMMFPMSRMPKPGQRFTLYMRAGVRRHNCRATQITSDGGQWVAIYHGRHLVSPTDALGWWPEERK